MLIKERDEVMLVLIRFSWYVTEQKQGDKMKATDRQRIEGKKFKLHITVPHLVAIIP